MANPLDLKFILDVVKNSAESGYVPSPANFPVEVWLIISENRTLSISTKWTYRVLVAKGTAESLGLTGVMMPPPKSDEDTWIISRWGFNTSDEGPQEIFTESTNISSPSIRDLFESIPALSKKEFLLLYKDHVASITNQLNAQLDTLNKLLAD